MLKGKVIFMFSLMKFDELNSSNFTIAKYLAQNNEVFYVENPLTIIDYYRLDKKSKAYQKRKKGFGFFSNGLIEDKVDGVNIIIPNLVLPMNFLQPGRLYNLVQAMNERLVLRKIRKVIRERKISDYIYINAYNFNYPTVAKRFNANPNVYYCVDPIPAYHQKHGLLNELKLLENTDVVLCTSKALYNEKRLLNKHCYFIPNGADLVDKVDGKALVPHKSLKGIPSPIIGYVGAIERRIDFELLKGVIQTNTRLSFVFVGPQFDSYVPNWCFRQKNIYFLPPVPYDEVPEVIFGFDVCIIPFKEDAISKSIFPLKLFEYLGIGKPVVLTDFNLDLKDFTGDLVHYASDSASFSSAINISLNNGTNDVEKRVTMARQNTWKSRANSFEKAIARHVKA